MSQPDYPLFWKRLQRDQYLQSNQRHTREKCGAYNFEKTKNCDLAEKWFRERKEVQREPIPTPTPIPTPPIPISTPIIASKPKGPPPGLIRPRHDSCDLDLKIPSYDEFHYVDPDEIVTSPLLTRRLSIYNFNINLFEEHQYSTPLIIEGDLPDDIDNYEGQLNEFEVQDAVLYDQSTYNQYMLSYQLYLQMLALSNMPPM